MKKPVYSKVGRARALAARLQEQLQLDACELVLNKRDAERMGTDLKDGTIKFYLRSGNISTFVPVSKKALSSGAVSGDYLFGLVTRVWLHNLKLQAAARILAIDERVGALNG